MVFYERFQLKGFDWEMFGVLDKWSLTRGGPADFEVRLDKTRQDNNYFIRGLIPADTSTVFQHFYT